MQKTFNMLFGKRTILCLISIFLVLFFFACKNSKQPPEKDVVKTPKQLEEHTTDNLKKLLTFAAENKGKLNDSLSISSPELVNTAYQKNNYETVWSKEDGWRPIGDSLYLMIEHAKEYGLFPDDYHFKSIEGIRARLGADSVSRRDAALWTRADVILTDAYLNIARHLKLGRLERDSITLRNDSLINDAWFLDRFNEAVSKGNIIQSLQSLEPRFPGYQSIKEGIKGFLDTARFINYTYIAYPTKDSLALIKSVIQRLSEEGLTSKDQQPADTAAIAIAIKKYQQSRRLKPTGKISESLVRSLNNTDWEKFKSIAVTLDSYKQMPDTVPETYVLVNLPSYTLYVYDSGNLVIQSKTIVGASKTRTPLLNSRITNFITYPQWTVPYSIIFKEMLPKIQNDISYLNKQNLMVVDRNDEVVDPHSIDWSKLSKTRFPYLLRQKEGDENSLGVIKFNFPNKYAVYLHDTNARSIFNRSDRAVSHGCVRVQQWEDLAHFLVRNDTARYPLDSLDAWMSRQEKHTITGFKRVPLYIRYFTVEGKDGELAFYNDIYGYDRLLKEKYFSKERI